MNLTITDGHLIVATPYAKRCMPAHSPNLISNFCRNIQQKLIIHRIKLIPKHEVVCYYYAILVCHLKEDITGIQTTSPHPQRSEVSCTVCIEEQANFMFSRACGQAVSRHPIRSEGMHEFAI